MSEKPNNPASPFMVYRMEIKNKAIEVSDFLKKMNLNVLVVENIAIAAAKHWAFFYSSSPVEGMPCKNVHLIPHSQGWALLSSGNLKLINCIEDRHIALATARTIAKSQKLKLFIHSEKGFIEDCECFTVNMPNLTGHRKPVERKTGWITI